MIKDEFLSRLTEAKANLDEAAKILSFEPEDSTEAQFCKSARNLRSQLDAFTQRLEKL